MNSIYAFMMGEMNRGKELMVFDWNKAAEIIRDKKATYAYAFLDQDAEWTGGTIYEDGEIVTDSYTYLASTWATPMLDIDTENGSEDNIPCYKMQHEVPNWNSDTKWPKSAIDILKDKEKNVKFKEAYTGREFYSSFENVIAGEKKLNHDFRQGLYVSLNDLYAY